MKLRDNNINLFEDYRLNTILWLPHFIYLVGSARNIAVKMEVLCGEDRQRILDVIYGKSSGPQFTSEFYASVNYHNRCPCFYDEFKIQLPANLGEQHHLFFTFYHVSCQRKVENSNVETPVGYTVSSIMKQNILTTTVFFYDSHLRLIISVIY